MKIWVAACSMIAEAIRLSSASEALWVQKPTMPLRLRMVFSQSLIRRTKTSSSSAFQPSSTTMIAGVPSSRCSTRWKRYIIAGVRVTGVVEDRGSCRSRWPAASRSSRSSALSNSQACSPSPHQAASRAARSPACGAARAPEQLAQVAQPTVLRRLREVGVDRIGDQRRDPRRSRPRRRARSRRATRPGTARLAGGVGQLQRVEAGGLARPQTS